MVHEPGHDDQPQHDNIAPNNDLPGTPPTWAIGVAERPNGWAIYAPGATPPPANGVRATGASSASRSDGRDWQRCTPERVCEICGRDHFCSYSPDADDPDAVVAYWCTNPPAEPPDGWALLKLAEASDGHEAGVYIRAEEAARRQAVRDLHAAPADLNPASADDAACEAFYYELWKHLPPIAPGHRAGLHSRRLTDEQIAAFDFRALPLQGRAEIVNATLPHADWCRVPGLWYDAAAGRVKLGGRPGMLIPCRDPRGNIRRVCIRADEQREGRKYEWLSSGGKPAGANATARSHWPLGTLTKLEADDDLPVVVVEGVLKADVAAALSPGWAIIGIPGVSQIRVAIRELSEHAAGRIIRLAADEDWRGKPTVARAILAAMSALHAAGFRVEPAAWPTTIVEGKVAPKGIDDALAAGVEITWLSGGALAERVRELREAAGVTLAATPTSAARAAGTGDAGTPGTPGTLDAAEIVEGQARERVDAKELDATVESRRFLDAALVDGVPSIAYDAGEWHRWSAGCWEAIRASDVETAVAAHVAERFYRPGTSHVANVLTYLKPLAKLPSGLTSPAWIGEAPRPWRAADCLATRSRVWHLPDLLAGATDAAISATPRLYTRQALDYEVDPAADCPTWRQFLGQVWPDDQESVDALQEWFGYLVSRETSQQKMAWLIGAKRGGKGTILRAATALIGASNSAAVSLAGLAEPFGGQPLIGKSLATLGDVRLGAGKDAARAMSLILEITGEDDAYLNRKGREAFCGRVPVRFMLAANELPRLPDAATATADRVLAFAFGESFSGREDPTLSDRLLAERAGILNWALAGLRRLRERGRFVQPTRGRELLAAYTRLSSPIAAFAADRLDLSDADAATTTADLFEEYRHWCRDEGIEPGRRETFGRNLRAAFPRLPEARIPTWAGSSRGYGGVRIRRPDPAPTPPPCVGPACPPPIA